MNGRWCGADPKFCTLYNRRLFKFSPWCLLNALQSYFNLLQLQFDKFDNLFITILLFLRWLEGNTKNSEYRNRNYASVSFIKVVRDRILIFSCTFLVYSVWKRGRILWLPYFLWAYSSPGDDILWNFIECHKLINSYSSLQFLLSTVTTVYCFYCCFLGFSFII